MKAEGCTMYDEGWKKEDDDDDGSDDYDVIYYE